MKTTIKCVTIIMVLMMMLGACTQETTSDNSGNTSGSTATGVVGKWRNTDGFWLEFTNNGGIYYQDGSLYGNYNGNDVEGELVVENGVFFSYKISGNSMTWTHAESGEKDYFTRM
jgi:hypothetical protein